ncbi:hypothetical protein J2S74_004251 [Evansella vedderi]|uniref:Methylamine utilisation protein MauE domain-containing protein n=1 Tax=Evansella vedderi TaxID=38282 RepID=A0ABU0A009_9BACI|nr:MauE/DoxX family redox-associated membrane protein [Evansella vedderi]MDQ0256829.1 hypothetical protein [Evansella vedderi]
MILSLYSIIMFHLVSLFIFSGMGKLLSLKDFVHHIINFEVLPKRLSLLYASLIPFLEILGAVFLLFDPTRMYGLAIILSLLISFSYGILRILKSGKKTNCNCYGKWMDTKVDYFTLGKVIYLLGLTVFILLLYLNGLVYSSANIGIGLFLTLLTLAAHKVWQVYKETMRQLKNKERFS